MGDLLIELNTILNAEYGIYLNNTNNAFVWLNEISDGAHGIYLDASGNNSIVRNLIRNNIGVTTGLHADVDSNDNQIRFNCFIDNIPQALDDGLRNNWDNNYWSDYPVEGGIYNIHAGSTHSQDHFTLAECPLKQEFGLQESQELQVPLFTPLGAILLMGLLGILAFIHIKKKPN
jgi:parallel beta-helix repeat protein